MSKVYKYLSFIIAGVGLLLGIILGNVFGIQKDIYTFTEAEFNYSIMFATWISTAFLFAIFFGMSRILNFENVFYDNLYVLNDSLKELEDKLKSIDEKLTK